MAFRVPSSPGLAHDRDPETFIGIEYPLKRGDGINGYFESTTTTLQAAKTNVRMLLETSQGERLMQPQLGTGLRRYLFEQVTDELRIMIENDIVDSFAKWLPFLTVVDITINMTGNTLDISVSFGLSGNPGSTASVAVSIGE
jgi:phage baseplate assembly protein W|tara:strand:+ start:307 stop:732 length:426 start_codon:yes stop_codon:yes gene_type:complete